jgi:NADH dehydrogenase
MRARVYLPARTAMSSGTAKTRRWVLDFAPAERRELDPLMGWTGSRDTSTQVRLTFATREEALDYARERGIEVTVTEPHKRKPNVRPGGYGENFSTNRRTVWTH